MKNLLRAVVVGLLLVPLCGIGSQASAQNTDVEELRRQIEAIQSQNEQQIEELRRKIEELELEKEVNKERYEDTKTRVEAKDAWYNNVEIGYKKPGDGFKIKSKDGNFSFRTRLRTQFQFSVDDVENEDTATNFDIRRLRLTFDGNAFAPWLFYTIQLDGEAASVRLRDAYFDFAYNTLFVPRIGQFKVPYNREQLNSSGDLQLVERSIIDDEFSFSRDVGAAAYGVLGNFVTYGVGAFDGNGRNADSPDSNLLYIGRLQFGVGGENEYKPSSFPSGGDFAIVPNFGEEDKFILTVGIGGLAFPGLDIGNKTPDNDIDGRFIEIFGEDGDGDPFGEADVYGLTADVNFKYWIFSAEGEYHFRNIQAEDEFDVVDSVTDQAFRVQAGIFLLPEFIEVAGRFAYITFDDDVPALVDDDGDETFARDSRYEITPGLNFYFAEHKYKLQLSYSFINDEFLDGEEVDENVFRAQFQASF